jgi:hypothetical protein
MSIFFGCIFFVFVIVVSFITANRAKQKNQLLFSWHPSMFVLEKSRDTRLLAKHKL